MLHDGCALPILVRSSPQGHPGGNHFLLAEQPRQLPLLTLPRIRGRTRGSRLLHRQAEAAPGLAAARPRERAVVKPRVRGTRL
jgi:hypothetical protein